MRGSWRIDNRPTSWPDLGCNRLQALPRFVATARTSYEAGDFERETLLYYLDKHQATSVRPDPPPTLSRQVAQHRTSRGSPRFACHSTPMRHVLV